MRLQIPIKMVEQNTCRLVTRFGRYVRRMDPGLNLMVPLIDVATPAISLKEDTKNFDNQKAITRDGLSVTLACTLYTRVVDPVKYHFAVDSATRAVEGIAQSLLRCEIGKLSLDQVLQQRQQLNETLSQEMTQYADRWGITCPRYEITHVDVQQAFSAFMNLEAESERERRRKQLEAQQIEATTLNAAQQNRVALVSQKTVEAKRVYFQLTAWAARVTVLRNFAELSPACWAILESKLKTDLNRCYAKLAGGNKQIFLRQDLLQAGRALGVLDGDVQDKAKADGPK